MRDALASPTPLPSYSRREIVLRRLDQVERQHQGLNHQCREKYQSVVEAYGRLSKEMSNEISGVYGFDRARLF